MTEGNFLHFLLVLCKVFLYLPKMCLLSIFLKRWNKWNVIKMLLNLFCVLNSLKWKYQINLVQWKKNENCIILIPREIHTVAARSAPRTSVKNRIWRTITRNWYTDTFAHPSINRGCRCLTWLYLAVDVDCSSMPITIDMENYKTRRAPKMLCIQIYDMKKFLTS